jgi:hypothetical protein
LASKTAGLELSPRRTAQIARNSAAATAIAVFNSTRRYQPGSSNPLACYLFIEPRDPQDLPFVFRRRAMALVGQIFIAEPRAAEKQKGERGAGVARYKQATLCLWPPAALKRVWLISPISAEVAILGRACGKRQAQIPLENGPLQPNESG